MAAAPILFDAFARTGKLPACCRGRPAAALRCGDRPSCRRLCSASAPALCAGEGAEPQLRIMFLLNGAWLELASDGLASPDPIALKVTGGAGALTVLVNGLPVPASRKASAVIRAGRAWLRAAHCYGWRAVRSTASWLVRLQ